MYSLVLFRYYKTLCRIAASFFWSDLSPKDEKIVDVVLPYQIGVVLDQLDEGDRKEIN